MFTTYIHPTIGMGRATIAVQHDPVSGYTRVGVAYSSPKDQFNKAKGRQIALGRIEKNSLLSFEFWRKSRDKKLKDEVLDLFVNFTAGNGPKWANKPSVLIVSPTVSRVMKE